MIPIEQLTSGAAAHRKKTGRPLVTVSYAQSLDGSITTVRGKSLKLSGNGSIEITHKLRSVHDAIMVGIGTALTDDPKLTVRHVSGDNPQPVILDTNLRLPTQAKLFNADTQPIILSGKINEKNSNKSNELERKGVKIYELPFTEGEGINLGECLNLLGEQGFNSLMVEGGARVISSLFQHRLVNQMLITIAPILVGGLSALETLLHSDTNSSQTNHFPQIEPMSIEQVGSDLVVWGPVKVGAA